MVLTLLIIAAAVILVVAILCSSPRPRVRSRITSDPYFPGHVDPTHHHRGHDTSDSDGDSGSSSSD